MHKVNVTWISFFACIEMIAISFHQNWSSIARISVWPKRNTLQQKELAVYLTIIKFETWAVTHRRISSPISSSSYPEPLSYFDKIEKENERYSADDADDADIFFFFFSVLPQEQNDF